jgi:hypothetical protein
MKTNLLLTLFLLLSLSGFSQKPVWGVDYFSFFDNREYNSKYNESQTFFGTRVTPQLSISVGEGQTIVGGFGVMFENGKKPFQDDPDPLIYYQYDSKNLCGTTGFFPREKMLGGYSTAFIRGTLPLYDPNMSGMLLQAKGSKGFAEIAIDWNGYRTDTDRESFLILSGGKYRMNRFYAAYQMSYFHYARAWKAPVDQHLVDNALIHLFGGYNILPNHKRDSAYVQLGYMQGLERIRGTNRSEAPKGLFAEVYFRHEKLGIKSTLYYGDHLMNFYSDFGSKVYWGDGFYRSNCYSKTDLFWNIVETKRTTLKLSSVHHFDGDALSWQQVLTLRIKI